MEGPGKESKSSCYKSRPSLLLIFCILSFLASCLAVVLFIRNHSVERQVKELEIRLWQEVEHLKAMVKNSAEYENTGNTDHTQGKISDYSDSLEVHYFFNCLTSRYPPSCEDEV